VRYRPKKRKMKPIAISAAPEVWARSRVLALGAAAAASPYYYGPIILRLWTLVQLSARTICLLRWSSVLRTENYRWDRLLTGADLCGYCKPRCRFIRTD
jgi:hypothetical protein